MPRQKLTPLFVIHLEKSQTRKRSILTPGKIDLSTRIQSFDILKTCSQADNFLPLSFMEKFYYYSIFANSA